MNGTGAGMISKQTKRLLEAAQINFCNFAPECVDAVGQYISQVGICGLA